MGGACGAHAPGTTQRGCMTTARLCPNYGGGIVGFRHPIPSPVAAESLLIAETPSLSPDSLRFRLLFHLNTMYLRYFLSLLLVPLKGL